MSDLARDFDTLAVGERMALRSVREAVFKRALRIGDTIHAEVEIAATRELDERRWRVECRWRVLNRHGKLVLRASTEIVWRRGERPDGDEAAGWEPLPL